MVDQELPKYTTVQIGDTQVELEITPAFLQLARQTLGKELDEEITPEEIAHLVMQFTVKAIDNDQLEGSNESDEL